MKKNLFLYCLVIIIIMAQPFAASARFFDPNDIFTDKELFDANSLSRTAIQQFLEAKGSVLKGVTALVNGVPKLVSEMIYEIGKQYGVSQKFLLAKLQHEQGLIEKTTASQNALDWATGYSCYNKRCNEKYRGIFAQLDAAADTQRIYAERTYFNYKVGQETKTTDGFKVTPANQATANLYIYTPYQGGTNGIGGNYAFWRVWNRYFTERPFADGALLKDETGNYWKIEKNKKRQFVSPEIYLKDYKETDAVPVASEKLAYYQTAAPIEFADNTVVRSASSNLMYLLAQNTKQRIVNEAALALLGYRLADTEPITPLSVTDPQLANYTEGEPITEQSVYPQGVLVQNGGGKMYLLKQGKRYPILDEAVWQMNFQKDPPLALSAAEIEKYPLADPIKLRDGSIVKSASGNFYVISVGKKLPITQEEIVKRIFGEQFYQTAPVVSEAVLALHEAGDKIDFINASVPDPVPYVSYAERVGPNNNQIETPAYLAVFDKVQVPTAMKLGVKAEAKVSFRNTGTAVWEPGKVQLEFFDENGSGSSFAKADENQAALTTTVAPGEIAYFTFTLTPTQTPGFIKEWFSLEYQNESGVFVDLRGAKVREEIRVQAPISGQIVSHNFPKSIRRSRPPVTVTVKIKNTSEKQVWTSRRTALIITAEDGGPSPFYDRYDWLDKQVAAVPFNLSKVKPGQTGLFRFRLDGRKVPVGTHTLRFTMELRDVKERVYLNDGEAWKFETKVIK